MWKQILTLRFKKRFIMTLSKLSDNEWKMLEKMVDTLHSKEI